MKEESHAIDATSGWSKVGRGLSFDFTLSLPVFTEVLLKSLPPEFSPYQLVYVKKTPVSRRRCLDTIIWREVSDFHLAIADDPANIFLGSKALMSNKVLDPNVEYPNAAWSLNGMILIQWKIWPPPQDSSLGIVHKVSRLDGSNLIHHEEYEKIFRALKSALRKAVAREASANS